MKEGCFGDVLHMLVEGEGLVKDDTETSDVRGGGEPSRLGEVVGGVVSGFGERFGSDNNF